MTVTSRPLSNGTMGDIWRDSWCSRCAHDHDAHTERFEDGGCPIIIKMLVDDYPIEELTRHDDDRDHEGWGACCLSCSNFEPCFDCGVEADYTPTRHA